MRASPHRFIVFIGASLLFACTGDPVGEAPTDSGSSADAIDSTAVDSTAEDSTAGDTTGRDGDGGAAETTLADTPDAASDGARGDATVIDSGACGVHPGPSMIQLSTGSVSFCIDTTEVTNAQYGEFLDDFTHPPTMPGYCAFDTDRGAKVTDGTLAKRPVTSMNFCDALAYCRWAGTRLCGKIGGGATPVGSFADGAVSEWSFACKNGSASTAYPYGAGFVDGTCATAGPEAASSLVDVGSKAGCHGATGAFTSIFDLSGNAGEFEDACSTYETSTAPGSRECHVRGGFVGGSAFDCASDHTAAMDASYDVTGFRCCAD